MHTQLILYCSLKGWSLKIYEPYCQVSWAKKVFLNSRLLLQGVIPVAFSVTLHIQHTQLPCGFWGLASPEISVFCNPCTPLLCNPPVILTTTCFMSPVQTMESIGLLSSYTLSDFDLFRQVIEGEIILALGILVLVQGLYLLRLNPTLLYNWKAAFCLWFCRYRRSTDPSVI
jgi:hypothetical protein